MTMAVPVGRLDAADGAAASVIARALGEELRRARETRGWSRTEFMKRLPSGIGTRTLLPYRQGTRHMTALRLIEICRAIGVSTPDVLTLGLPRTEIALENLALWVDLTMLVADGTITFRSVIKWAHNKLLKHPTGVVKVGPAGVDELATVVGCPTRELAVFLTRFTPDVDQIPEAGDRTPPPVN